MCCACAMVCNHVGPHAYCAAHTQTQEAFRYQEAGELFRVAQEAAQHRAALEVVRAERDELRERVRRLERRVEEVREAGAMLREAPCPYCP